MRSRPPAWRSRSQSVRPARAAPRASGSKKTSARSGDERGPEPPLRPLSGELQAARGKGGEIDGKRRARSHGQRNGLAFAFRQRKGEVPTLVGDALAPQGHLDDVKGLAQASERPIEAHPVHPLHHLRAAHPEPQHEPPAGHAVETQRGHRDHGRNAGRDLHDAGAEADAGRDRGEIGHRGHRILAPRFRRPREVHPEAFRLAHVLDHVGPVVALAARASERDRRSHEPTCTDRPPGRLTRRQPIVHPEPRPVPEDTASDSV